MTETRPTEKPIPLAEAAFVAGVSMLTLRRACIAERIAYTVEWPKRRYAVTSKAIKTWIAAGRPTRPITEPSKLTPRGTTTPTKASAAR